jgi:hypothetical protein
MKQENDSLLVVRDFLEKYLIVKDCCRQMIKDDEN